MDYQTVKQNQQPQWPAPLTKGILQRQCACSNHTIAGGECETCNKRQRAPQVQRSAINNEPINQAPQVVQEVLRSSGQPLDEETRAYMEPRFGHDFSHVRVHSDAQAAASAKAVNALAYTVGRDVIFGTRQYAPSTTTGQRLLAHELAHVVQQSSGLALSPGIDRGPADPLERAANFQAEQAIVSHPSYSHANPFAPKAQTQLKRSAASDHGSLLHIQRRQEVATHPAMPPTEDEGFWEFILKLLRKKGYEGGGGKSGGGGSSDEWSPSPIPGYAPPSPLPPSLPPSQPAKKLDFYHGSRWSIAKRIPKNVKPIGGGDFAIGFYTHHDTDNAKALGRAVAWGRRMANQKPTEPYAGVVRFGVLENDYVKLSGGGKAKGFGLERLDQPDFKEKQKAWLDFVTSHGREAAATFNEKRGEWVHHRREPQPTLPYNIVAGPFYTPLKGTKDKKPAQDEFKPYAEGKQLPQQVTWANDGINLLNSTSVETQLMQFDAKTGRRQDPPIDTAAPAGPLNLEQLTEEAQLDLGKGEEITASLK